MELLKHNIEVYEKVLKMFETENKAAVVQPTGTGKMYIAIKWLLDNKDKKLLFLAPNSTIMYQFKKTLESNGHSLSEFSNIKFALYYQMLNWDDENFEKYDCIVLDELHRAGALKWGEKVNQLLSVNQDSKVLGLTATPTRYMDKRNMVDEIFEGNIASEITLAEAMAREILPFPTYISSLYSLEVEINKYQDKTNNTKDENKKAKAQKLLDKVKSNASNALNISEVLTKHITKKDGHYIIFCKDLEHLEKIKGKLNEWFKDINSNMSVYDVHYKKTGDENEQSLIDFESNNDESIKILLSIDKLNEGLHVDNIDGVIMMRLTASHIIYLQQLGRALSCNSKGKPLIIDFVNGLEAYKNLYDVREAILNYYRENGYSFDKEKFDSLFKVYDYIQNIMNTLNEIDSMYRLSSAEKIVIIKQYLSEGNSYSDIKMNRTMYKEYPIGHWISNWRYLYEIGNLNELIEQELRLLGESFEGRKSKKKTDLEKIEIINQYIADGYSYNDIKKDTKYGEYPLGTWVNDWRMSYKADKLKKDTEQKLRSLGETFEVKHRTDISEEQKISILKEYLKAGNKYSDIKQKGVYNGYTIGQWIMIWRRKQQQGNLKPEIEYFLRSVGETFEHKIRNKMTDVEKIVVIKEYLDLGHSYHDITHLMKYQDYPIGIWKNRFRNQYKKGTIDPNIERLLRNLGENFMPRREKLNVNFDVNLDNDLKLTKENITETKGKSL